MLQTGLPIAGASASKQINSSSFTTTEASEQNRNIAADNEPQRLWGVALDRSQAAADTMQNRSPFSQWGACSALLFFKGIAIGSQFARAHLAIQ
jgi:hypothetical protein